MNYLAGRGDVPRCYRMVLRNGNADTITKTMKLPYAGAVIHPSMKLEKMADRYLEALDKWQYKASSKRLYSHDLLGGMPMYRTASSGKNTSPHAISPQRMRWQHCFRQWMHRSTGATA